MKCFYHNDADGQIAATWVHAHVGLHDEYYLNDTEESFISISYKDEFPFESIRPNEQIYIVDFSIQPEEMLELLKITKDVTWVDHHKTAIEKYKDFPHEIRGVRYDGVSGCELTYAYIHHMTQRGDGDIKPFELSMLEDCPMATRFIGDRDVWKFEFDDTKSFYAGYQIYTPDPTSAFMFDLITDDGRKELVSILTKQGETIEQFKKQQRKYVVDTYAQELEFEGYNCLVCNSHDKTSELFGDRFDNYDLCSVYCFDGKQYTVSLYSQKVDVSKIAVKYGGGGHAGASGFVCSEVPYLIK